ncbi:hypothetical protein HKX48_005351 [Thoreauomyces humboldtii]|nr:hypothetical protein HKX48_005351 [Thoreauomyces humboldtii]
MLDANPQHKAAFLSAVAAKPEVARAFRDLDDYLFAKGYADPRNPTHRPDEEIRARMEADNLLMEKTLLVQKLLQAHGIVRMVAPTEQAIPEKSHPNHREGVLIVDAALPMHKLGLEPLAPTTLSKPLQWFKSFFMTSENTLK